MQFSNFSAINQGTFKEILVRISIFCPTITLINSILCIYRIQKLCLKCLTEAQINRYSSSLSNDEKDGLLAFLIIFRGKQDVVALPVIN